MKNLNPMEEQMEQQKSVIKALLRGVLTARLSEQQKDSGERELSVTIQRVCLDGDGGLTSVTDFREGDLVELRKLVADVRQWIEQSHSGPAA